MASKIIICLLLSGLLYGSVVLEIGTGIVVETSGDVSVQVDSLESIGISEGYKLFTQIGVVSTEIGRK